GSFVLPFLIGLVYVAIEKRKSLRIEIEEIKRQTDE
ncbi:lysylphosphatidylglycerol synthase transmembrane domain-containing protein, partial [Enterococcus faecium]